MPALIHAGDGILVTVTEFGSEAAFVIIMAFFLPTTSIPDICNTCIYIDHIFKVSSRIVLKIIEKF